MNDKKKIVGEITSNFSLNPSMNQKFHINMKIYMHAFKVTFGWAVLYIATLLTIDDGPFAHKTFTLRICARMIFKTWL